MGNDTVEGTTLGPTCATCIALSKRGVKIGEADTWPWSDALPLEADNLEVFAPGQGHADTWQIRRCRGCGTLYRYTYHSEYDVTGSWDEYYLWRLGPAAQQCIGSILATPTGRRGKQLAAALHHEAADLRKDAALLLWVLVDQGERLGQALVSAACEALADSVHLVGNYCYYALLGYIHRGPSEVRRVRQTLKRLNLYERDTHFTWILLRECGVKGVQYRPSV